MADFEASIGAAVIARGDVDAVVAEAGVDLDGARVVDFGCGTGLLTERLVGVGASVHAVDTSRAMLAVLDTKVVEHGWSQVTTGVELPVDQGSHDLIVCSSVCSFLDDYPGTAVDLVELLRPGGLFVQWDWERTDDDEHGLARHEIEAALGRAGLEPVVVETAFSVPMGEATMEPLIGHGRVPA
jgi:2-polyprenyl-3-methyl-5-hydroxy-6-metoxy-1,4-benzoquinol methylase